MLTIIVPETEFFNEANQEFEVEPAAVVELEHSLVSLSKWESKWEKPFLGLDTKTEEETLSYVDSMILSPNLPAGILERLQRDHLQEINEYVVAKMTATWFKEEKNPRPSRETITAEIIYNWMIQLQIPFECQTWHLNRLLTLIRVCQQKNAPAKKMSPREMLQQRRALNEKRKSQYGTRG